MCACVCAHECVHACVCMHVCACIVCVHMHVCIQWTNLLQFVLTPAPLIGQRRVRVFLVERSANYYAIGRFCAVSIFD